LQYVVEGQETRYLAASVDLNGDQRPEWVVHVVGPMACGTGGCPTLVFTPQGAGYRLINTINVSRPPVRVAAQSSHGWRDLIVHIGGGGGKAGDVALAFDGRAYPGNPTVPGPRVTPAALAGAEVLIADFQSFTDALPLPPADGPALVSAATGGVGPSFDCKKAAGPVEKRVCADPDLAALDRALAQSYAKGQQQWPPENQTQERAAQRAWLAQRNACIKASDLPACIKVSYQRRLVALQIRNGDFEVPAAVGYVCQGQESTPFTAVFYNQADPRAAVLTFGDRQEIVFATPSGSGAKYANPRVEFWEHHGEAAVMWGGKSYSCWAR
ncbi:MAG: MliC family protein, partial [Zoogloeaceae bacterium]|nr:MliC family protein [Zoogloeaceae bacterium]